MRDAREPPIDCRAGTYMEALVEGTPNSWIRVMVVVHGATGKLTLLDLNGDQLGDAQLSSIRSFRSPWCGRVRLERRWRSACAGLRACRHCRRKMSC